MDHRDHLQLLRQGIPGRGGTWADLGSGKGAFTLALAELIGEGGQIHSVDKIFGYEPGLIFMATRKEQL